MPGHAPWQVAPGQLHDIPHIGWHTKRATAVSETKQYTVETHTPLLCFSTMR